MNTPLIKILDFWKFHQLVDEQGVFWKNPGLGILSWILIGLAIFILAIGLIFWMIKSVIKAGVKGLVSILEFIWKHCIWWWLKWIFLGSLIFLIVILIIQGIGMIGGNDAGFWWVFQGMIK